MASANKDVKIKFKQQIALAKQNQISWEDLAMILDVLTPTFMSLKNNCYAQALVSRDSLQKLDPLQLS